MFLNCIFKLGWEWKIRCGHIFQKLYIKNVYIYKYRRLVYSSVDTFMNCSENLEPISESDGQKAAQQKVGAQTAYSFDSTALERAANAAKTLESSSNARQAFEITRMQEVTRQQEIDLQRKVKILTCCMYNILCFY